MRRPIRIRRWLRPAPGVDLTIPRKHSQHRRDGARLLKQLALAARDCKSVWRVNSFYRSNEEQAELYKRNMNPKTGKPRPGRPLTAKPGASNHNKGKAVDASGADGHPVARNKNRRNALIRRGLCCPVAGEQWHVEIGNVWRV